jgi:hypothetical protein
MEAFGIGEPDALLPFLLPKGILWAGCMVEHR